MKKTFIAAGLALVLAGPAFAEDAAVPPMEKGEKRQEHREMKFDERKAKILEHMSARIAEMQKRQSCVQAAATPEALKACMPEGYRKRRHGGPGGGNEGDEGKHD